MNKIDVSSIHLMTTNFVYKIKPKSKMVVHPGLQNL